MTAKYSIPGVLVGCLSKYCLLCLLVLTTLCISGCECERDATKDAFVKDLIGERFELQEDVFLVKCNEFGKRLNPIIGDSHLPKSVEVYYKYGDKWHEHDETYQRYHKINKTDAPDEVLGVINKGSIIEIVKVQETKPFFSYPSFGRHGFWIIVKISGSRNWNGTQAMLNGMMYRKLYTNKSLKIEPIEQFLKRL